MKLVPCSIIFNADSSQKYGGREGTFDFYFWIGHFQSRISKIIISKFWTTATFALASSY